MIRCLILLLLYLVSRLSYSSEITITLEDAIKYSLDKMESIKIGKARIDQSDAKREQDRSRMLPTLNFEGSYQEQKKTSSLLKDGLWGDKQSYTRFHLTQSLYEGWRDINSFNASSKTLLAQEANLKLEKNFLIVSVAKAFYQVLSDQKELENLNKTIELAKARLQEINERVKIGKSRDIESTSAQAQLAIMQSQKMAIEGGIESAYEQLTYYIGLSSPLKLVDTIKSIQAPKNLDSYLQEIEKKPAVESARLKVEAMENLVVASKGNYLPSIDLSGSYYPTREGSRKDNDWDASLNLTFPLYTGGMTSAKVKEAVANKTEALQAYMQVKRKSEMEIKISFNNLISALSQIEALENALKLTEKNFKQQERNYRYGQATNLEVISALNTFQETKRTLDKLTYQAKVYFIELQVYSNEYLGHEDQSSKKS